MQGIKFWPENKREAESLKSNPRKFYGGKTVDIISNLAIPIGMKKVSILTAIIISLGSIVLAVHCGDKESQKPTAERVLKNLDKNKDGKISKAEWLQPLKTRFAKADKDKNDVLNEAEIKASHIRTKEQLKKLDTNHDNKLSKQEHLDPRIKRFNRFDKNKDGFLDKAELQKL